MNLKNKIFSRLLTLSLILAVIVGGTIWILGTVDPVAAQEPVPETADLTVRIVPSEDGFSIASADPIPTFDVGDTFTISIVAENAGDPGIFGSQFEVIYDPTYLEAVESSLVSGAAMEPVVIARAEFNLVDGLVGWAASRQGDVENVAGDVVLATLSLQAVAPTEPPEGQTTSILLENVKLGAKGGIEVPVTGIVGLDVIIREDDGSVPGNGDIEGQATVEGRAADNQAGHQVTAAGDLGGVMTATTETDGSFFFNNAPADTYAFTADSPGFLAATCEGVAHAADALTTLAGVTLLAGDIVDPGVIDITDAVAMGLVFGSTDPGEVADLNADGVVDILDLILMAVNFDQTSVGNPWVCQTP